MDYLKVANGVGMWIACLPMLIIVVIQVTLIYKRAKSTSKLVNLTDYERKTAFKSGLITAIGPSFSSFIAIIAMSAVMGAPISWQRTSVIAAADVELRASQFAASAMGMELGGPGFTMTAFDACLWVMALNGCGAMLFCLLFTDKMSLVTNKLTNGNSAMLNLLATSAIIGVIMCMSTVYAGIGGGSLCALIAAAISRVLLDQIAKRLPKLKLWSMGISLLIGMFFGSLYAHMI